MTEMKLDIVNVSNITIANNLPFVFIGGPCQIESIDHAIFIADSIKKITTELGIPFIYKSSFDKANRTSILSKRGLGIKKGLEILYEVKEKIGCPIVTDVHTADQCDEVAKVVDILQIPAFLCRQTDLLEAAARTGKVVKVKKGQFLSPWEVKNIYDKLRYFGCKNIILTERGVSFGYNTLISDMRSLPIMAKTGAPIFFDATHSVQCPGGFEKSSGGQREFVEILGRASIAVGVAGIFMEVHQDPDNAPSDGPCMIKLENLRSILNTLKKYDQLTKNL